jgi:precorrin-6A/cobalt-precorrin-6A reductase
MTYIWLIGGTKESRAIAQGCIDRRLPCLVTVTTESALHLYPDHPNLRVQIGQLNPTEAISLCQIHRVCAIVDASHPFATQISKLATDTAQQLHIPYLRYQRPVVAPSSALHSPILYLDKVGDLLKEDYLAGQRVFLTLGYKVLPVFQPWQQRSILFARVLPRVDSLQVALTSGFTPDRLIALRPPIALDLERALWQQWQINLVVTKESGLEEGQAQKQRLAQELGIPLIILKRPPLRNRPQTSDLSEILNFCQQVF